MITEKDFKEYRSKLCFTRQDDFKKFLSAKDIEVSIDFAYLDKLNLRLEDIFNKINKIHKFTIKVKERKKKGMPLYQHLQLIFFLFKKKKKRIDIFAYL